MKISTAITALFAIALVVFGGQAMNAFKSTVSSTTDSATSQQVTSVSGGFDAAFAIADN